MLTLFCVWGGARKRGNAGASCIYLNPEILVEGACNHASLKEDENPLLVALGNFKVEVLPPVAQLCSLQGLHMEVGTLDLRGGEWRRRTERGRKVREKDKREKGEKVRREKRWRIWL